MTDIDELIAALTADGHDVCSGGELLDRVSAGRRTRRFRPTVAAAVGAVLAAGSALVFALHQAAPSGEPAGSTRAAATTDQPSSVPSTVGHRVELSGHARSTVVVPQGWAWERDRGMPGTIADGLIFASDRRMAPQCRSVSRTSCGRGFGLPSWWQLAPNQVVVSWTEIDYPTGRINAPAGRRTVVDGHRAWITTNGTASDCPGGTASSFVGWVQADRPTDRLIMTACFGPAASRADRRAAHALFGSLRLR